MASHIYLIRHGETEWSRSRQHTSFTDLPLTEAGERSADELAERLAKVHVDAVFTSPRLRASETARRALGSRAVEFHVLEELTEWHYGSYEGLTTATIRADHHAGWDLWTDGAPGGESPADVTARVTALFDRFDATDGVVACFAHGHILRAVGALWIGAPIALGANFQLGTAAICKLGYEHEQRAIEMWNMDPLELE
jgi:broad specificity phosphatase PhoE